MLDFIRNNAQSWGVKLAFLMIIIVFVFWGASSFNSPSDVGVMAYIDEEPLLESEFNTYYNQKEAELLSSPGISKEFLKQINFKGQLFNNMLGDILIQNEAKRLSITVSDPELKAHILSIPVFQKDGTFDPELYKTVLANQGLNPAIFEQEARNNLLLQKIRSYIFAAAFVTDTEAEDFFNFTREQRSIQYSLFPFSKYINEVFPDEKQIEEYYEQHKQEYQIPRKLSFDYILLTPEALAHTFTVSDKQIEDYYDAQKEKEFTHQEKVSVRHILIGLPEDAQTDSKEAEEADKRIQELYVKLQKGEDFAVLAGEYSEDSSRANGGEIGFIEKGMVLPAFEEVAFSLKPGEYSKPFRTPYGFHIAKVEKYEPHKVEILVEVKDKIVNTIKQNQGAEKIQETLELALDDILSGKNLDEITKTYKLKKDIVDKLSKEQIMADLQVRSDSIDLLFAVSPGLIIDRPINLQNGYLLAKVTDIQSEYIESLENEDIKLKVINALKDEGAKVLALKAAEEALKTATPESRPKDLVTPLVISDLFTRQNFIPGLGQVADLVKASFEAKIDTWLPMPYPTMQGPVIAKLIDIRMPTESDWSAIKDMVKDELLREKQKSLFVTFVRDLQAKANIKIVNMNLIVN